MIAFVCFRFPRWFPVAHTVAAVMLVLSSCSLAPADGAIPPRPPLLELPQPLADSGPQIPFRTPNLLGDPQLAIEPFTDLSQIEACLNLGQVVYGIALQNTNVRQAPTLDACRVGRIPRGTLVAVTGIISPTVADPASVT
ncbi:MAG: hypothetical protein KDE47_06990, partial [Caldilineaceae bacterium]|nr:hypothetical protein [Caldilineaceae bacterium]